MSQQAEHCLERAASILRTVEEVGEERRGDPEVMEAAAHASLLAIAYAATGLLSLLSSPGGPLVSHEATEPLFDAQA